MSGKEVKQAQKSWESARGPDLDKKLLDEGFHNRSGDPAKSAQRTNVSQTLNGDAAKYKKPSNGQ